MNREEELKLINDIKTYMIKNNIYFEYKEEYFNKINNKYTLIINRVGNYINIIEYAKENHIWTIKAKLKSVT
jgi:hypothetical protein